MSQHVHTGWPFHVLLRDVGSTWDPRGETACRDKLALLCLVLEWRIAHGASRVRKVAATTHSVPACRDKLALVFLLQERWAIHGVSEVGQRVEISWPYYFLCRMGGQHAASARPADVWKRRRGGEARRREEEKRDETKIILPQHKERRKIPKMQNSSFALR